MYCAKGMDGARRDGRKWAIDADKATQWMIDKGHAPRIAGRQPVTIESNNAAPEVAESDNPLDDQVRMMRAIVAAMTESIAKGQIDPRIVTMLKQVSSELRELVEMQRREREADAKLMERETHRQAVTTLARLIEVEGNAMAGTMPDAIISALAEAGIEFEDPKRAAQTMTAAVREGWQRTLDRMATFIRDAGNAKG